MAKPTNCRIVIDADSLHFQEFVVDGKILTGDFEAKPDGFECYYEFIRNGQPFDIEIPWEHFHGLLRLCALRIAGEKGVNEHSLI